MRNDELRVSVWARNYWACVFIWEMRSVCCLEGPTEQALRLFDEVWQRDFASNLRDADWIRWEHALDLLPNDKRRNFFKEYCDHCVLNLEHGKYLLQIDSEAREVMQIWRVPKVGRNSIPEESGNDWNRASNAPETLVRSLEETLGGLGKLLHEIERYLSVEPK